MSTQTGVADAGAPQATGGEGHLTGYGTKAYRSYVLNALLIIYILNFLDRSLLGVVSEPIMHEFGITDFWFGLLTGPAFAIFYAFVGIPLARFAETGNRVMIMTICIALWSAATAFCGMAVDLDLGFGMISGFVMLCFFRVLVGVGEAGCTPPANSLIADYYPPKRRSTALGYYAMGVTLGTLSANLIGGPVNEMFRAMFTESQSVAQGLAYQYDTYKLLDPVWRLSLDTFAGLSTLTADQLASLAGVKATALDSLQGFTPEQLTALGSLTDAQINGFSKLTPEIIGSAPQLLEVREHGVSMGWRSSFVIIGIVGVFMAIAFKLTVKEPPRGYSDPPGVVRPQRASFAEALKELGSKPTFWLMATGATLSSFCGYGITTFQTSFFVRTHTMTQTDVTLYINVPSAFAASIGVFMTGWLAEKMVKRYPNAIAWLPAVGLIACVPFYYLGFSATDKWFALFCICCGAAIKYGYLAAQYTIGQGVVGIRTRATATAILLFIINLIGYGLGPLFIGALSDILYNMQAAATPGMEELARSSCKGAAINQLAPDQRAFCALADASALQNSLVITSVMYALPALFFLLCMKTLQKDLVAK